MILLTKELILLLHDDLIREFGGSYGVREEGLLESAVYAPFQSFQGTELYPSVCQKAARLGYGLVKNHAFVDGNKRIGAHAMLVFLSLNHIELKYTQKELADMILSIAAGTSEYEDLLQWIIDHREII